MNARAPLSRRRFVQASLTAAGGLAVGFHLPAAALVRRPWEVDEQGAEINAWLVIAPDDTVTIRVAQSEMGEGVFTALPMIVAEELECDWRKVRAEYASANRSLREDRVYRRMGTGGSRAVRHSREYLQQAGASARERLVRAAAERWGVGAGECRARDGVVTHTGSGRTLAYGKLAADAAKVRLDAEPAIREPSAFRLLGTPTKRLDTPPKTDGSAVFGMDVRPEGLVYAAPLECPVWGGKLASVDDSNLEGLRGIVAVVELESAVAVVADSWWRAKKGLDALRIEWDYGEHAHASSAGMLEDFRASLDAKGVVAHESGDAYGAIGRAERVVEADYDAPYLAHMCMEPLNCTVAIGGGRVDVWAGHQNPETVLGSAAEVAGVAPENVHVHNCFLGGGFGRRSNPDYIRLAVAVAKRVERPVQTIWSREADTATGWFRPLAAFRFRAGLDAAGTPTALVNRSATHSIIAGFRPDAVADGIDGSSVEGLENQPYAIPNQSIEHHLKRTHVPVWFWRSVGSSQNAFAVECFVDELAHAAGKDPYELRRALLGRQDFLKVLDTVTEKAEWGRKLPRGTAQGLAIHESFGSITAQVAEVAVSRKGEVRVERIVNAIDCGHTVNPLTIDAQMQSGIVYGLSAALWGRVDIEDGRAQQDNFDDYRVLKLAEMPRIETHLALTGGDKWGGVGEPGLPPTAPAVCNAIFAVTGKRVRSLPIAKHDLSWS